MSATLDPSTYALSLIREFGQDVTERLKRVG
jgi:hypothetical protein